MAEAPPLAFIVDDEPAMRQAVDRLLRSVGIETRLFASPQELLTAERPDRPGCIVLDVMFPDGNGLAAQRQVAAATGLPIIFVTGHAEVPMAVQAIRDGAVHFLTKPFRDQALLDAVSAALDRDRERRNAAQRRAVLSARFAALTPREREVMELVVAGHANAAIGTALGMSAMTVKIHRARVMRKMEAHNLVELLRLSDQLAAAPPDRPGPCPEPGR